MKISRPMILTLLGLFVLFGGIFGFNALKSYFIHKFFAHFELPPQTVSTLTTRYEDWVPRFFAVGTLSAVDGVDISSEVPGKVTRILFASGQFVKQGDPLIQLDDTTEKALLADAQAQLQLAEINLNRTKSLFSQNASTQSALDDASSKVKQLRANYENISSTISKKLIRTPFDGRIGLKQVNVGQFLRDGQVFVSLQATKALYARFALSQRFLSQVSLKQRVKVTADAYPNETFEGFVSAVDSKVDDNTRTIEVQATIDNAKGHLYPGMSVSVELLMPARTETIVLPQTAVIFTLYGDSVYLVTPGESKTKDGQTIGRVKRVLVKVGDQQDNRVVILDGIKHGDIVVDSGQSKLDDGAKVIINNTNPL